MSVVALARRALLRALRALPEPPAMPTTSIAEITPMAFRPGRFPTVRLNLVLPSINPEHYFGGIHTAIEVFRQLACYFPATRIVLTDSAPRPEALARFAGHEAMELAADTDAAHQIVAVNDRYGRTLPVSPGDVFLATAWWTALLAQEAARFRDGANGPGGIAYLIQDFEPGFYAWSSRHALAASSYRQDRDFAIFNTGLLRDFFTARGFDFGACSLAFEPTLNPGLRAALDIAAATPARRERTILLYARPGTPRNAFELACESIREWRRRCPHADAWQVVGIGELDTPMDLGGVVVEGRGKLSIEAYADELSRAAVGFSLMISPHPSYPPLEMAAFGLRTVTNGHANKDLGALGDAVRSTATLSPSSLAVLLAQACDEAERAGMLPCAVGRSVPPGFLAAPGPVLPDAGRVAAWLEASAVWR